MIKTSQPMNRQVQELKAMKISTLNALFNQLEKDIVNTLQNEVAETVKDEMQTAVQRTVYDAYTPKQYSRRLSDGGMLDGKNIQCVSDGHTLTVKNIAPLDNGRTDYALDDIVVNGMGYMPYPRDFYSECAEQLKTSEKHVEALKQGLKKKGYGVK